jgi:beta-glucosidase
LEYNSLGQKKTVSFTVGPADLQLLDRNMHWVVVPGTFDMMIGKSSADIGLQGTLEVHESGGLAGYE